MLCFQVFFDCKTWVVSTFFFVKELISYGQKIKINGPPIPIDLGVSNK
jgi:hypothetical protein